MIITAKSLTQLVLGTVVGIGVVSLLLPQPSWADAASEANPLHDFQPQQDGDPFSDSTEEDSLGVFDLIHRAQMGNLTSPDDYSAQQNQNLDAAAADFRARQRQQIQAPAQAAPVNPVNTPTVAN